MNNPTLSFFRLFILILAMATAVAVQSMPQLPETDLTWKNVSVDGKKLAVFNIFRDSRGIMWLGTNNGLFFYDGVTTHAVSNRDMTGIQVYALAEADDKLYIGSNNGLIIYDYLTGKLTLETDILPREIRSFLLDGKDLWIGGLNGISKLDLTSGDFEDFSEGLPHRSVYSILKDSRGIIYAGTYHGLARWDSKTSSFHPLRIRIEATDLSSLFANCMLESNDKESIFVGSEGNLYRYLPSADRWDKIRDVENNNIKSLANGKQGHILIGTDNGVFDLFKDTVRHYRHNSRQEQSLADNEIWCIYSDDDQNVWAGHERGFSIASNSSLIRNIKLSDLTNSGEGNDIYSIFRDSRNDLWFAGTNGAIRLSEDKAPEWYRHSDASHSLSHNRVRAIHEDSDNNIWFATDGGINRLDRANDNFDIFHITDSTGENASNWVYALVEDKGKLWVGSFLSGIRSVDKSKFSGKGGKVIADMTINSDSSSCRSIKLRNDFVNNVIKDKAGNMWILLFRDSLLTRVSPDLKRSDYYDVHALTGGYPNSICEDSDGRIWCSYKGGVMLIRNDGTYATVRFPNTNSDESILAMGKVGSGIWVSTQSNLWNIDAESLTAKPLPVPQKRYTAIYEDKISGKVFLGATDEIVEVDVEGIGTDLDIKTINMVLDDKAGSLDLSDLKSGAGGLRIPYGGSITLVVSTLDYSPESVQRYMYKLTDASDESDSDNGWVIMPEGSNTITFSDLKMGHYNLKVKTLGSTAAPLSIPVIVAPPLWLSWWTISLYVLAAVLFVCWLIWYLRRKNLRSFREQERQTALENVERKLTFLSTISHDLKTPLSMIIGPVSMMKEHARDPESKRNLETVYENAVRLNNMIHRTIELQHLEDTDDNLLIMSVFDVVDFCRGVFEVFKDHNPLKKFVFHSSCPQIFIEADAVKFESVITNLLSNACKYSDEGSTISIGISTHDTCVEIVVSDDGIGIADIDQPLVFERMFRAPSTSSMHEGTGLGLYLIKKYLELMHGTINLYSKEGQGTSFVVSLPVSTKINLPAQFEPIKEDDKHGKILIVEDNIEISKFLQDILIENFTCISADNGRSGLSLAASFMPDLIIADEMMPIMSGLEMVRHLKQNPRLSSIPIIMLTAKSDNATENESIKLGIDVFMTKPFDPASLLGRVSQLLKSRSLLRERLRIQTIAEAESRPIEAESVAEKSLKRIIKIIEENISDPDLNVSLLCEKSGIPNKQLYRLIKKYIGMAPLDYIRSVRLQKAAMLLSQHRFTVSEISYMVGFKTPSYFAKCFYAQFGIKPSQYQSDDENVDLGKTAKGG